MVNVSIIKQTVEGRSYSLVIYSSFLGVA